MHYLQDTLKAKKMLEIRKTAKRSATAFRISVAINYCMQPPISVYVFRIHLDDLIFLNEWS